MVSNNAIMVLGSDPDDLENTVYSASDSALDAFESKYFYQDCYAEETAYGACPDGGYSCFGTYFDASLEEVLHLITSAGYAYATARNHLDCLSTRAEEEDRN